MSRYITKILKTHYPISPSQIIAFILILSVGCFFRLYQLVERYNFDHDGDLYSWIVKDILVNHHFRLIGQQTTAPGIFIGPLFYYLIAPFYPLFNFDPIGAIFPITLISILALISYYIVFSKLFNPTVGLLAMFLQAVLLSSVYFDRRIVPTTLTNIWSVWYLWTIIMLVRGQLKYLPLLGVLIGLIWNIHIALTPSLVAALVALLLSHKLPSFRQILLFLIAITSTSLPLLLFEFKHNFIQTISLIQNFLTDHGGGKGWPKYNLVMLHVSGNLERLYFYPQKLPFIHPKFLFWFIILSLLIPIKQKLLTIKEVLVLLSWIFGIILFFSLSTSPISEYYFASFEIIFILLAALILFLLFKLRFGKYLILILLLVILGKNLTFFINEKLYNKGYLEKKQAVQFIVRDAKEQNYPCVAISYITAPGENVGFRYFFWLYKLKIKQPDVYLPVYTIVIPSELAQGKRKKEFGHIGVIPPDQDYNQETIIKKCEGEDYNLTQPLINLPN